MVFPKSCDTFVVLPPVTRNSRVVFGKNSDRPQNEVQEVVLIKGSIRDQNLKVKLEIHFNVYFSRLLIIIANIVTIAIIYHAFLVYLH